MVIREWQISLTTYVHVEFYAEQYFVIGGSFLFSDVSDFAPHVLPSVLVARRPASTSTSTIMRAWNQLLLLAYFLVVASGFQVAPPACRIHRVSVARTKSTTLVSPLSMSDPDNRDNENVRVDLVEDVDSVTLTAIGFGLIAFNFLVLANMGDGGIGGLVARFINFWNS